MNKLPKQLVIDGFSQIAEKQSKETKIIFPNSVDRCHRCICFYCEFNCELGNATEETAMEDYCLRCDECVEFDGKKYDISSCGKFRESRESINRRAEKVRETFWRMK